jgi:hypothetical protein
MLATQLEKKSLLKNCLRKFYTIMTKVCDFRQGSKTKKWQIEAKPTWHLFWKSVGSAHKTVLKESS